MKICEVRTYWWTDDRVDTDIAWRLILGGSVIFQNWDAAVNFINESFGEFLEYFEDDPTPDLFDNPRLEWTRDEDETWIAGFDSPRLEWTRDEVETWIAGFDYGSTGFVAYIYKKEIEWKWPKEHSI